MKKVFGRISKLCHKHETFWTKYLKINPTENVNTHTKPLHKTLNLHAQYCLSLFSMLSAINYFTVWIYDHLWLIVLYGNPFETRQPWSSLWHLNQSCTSLFWRISLKSYCCPICTGSILFGRYRSTVIMLNCSHILHILKIGTFQIYAIPL